MKVMAGIVIAASLCGIAQAADKPCSKADAANAQKAIDSVVTWPQLHKAWADYRQCDQGEIADLYTDALLRLTVSWKNVDAFSTAVQKDPQYKAFVYQHLNSPAAKDDVASINSRARASCPAGHDAFCAELADALKPGAAK